MNIQYRNSLLAVVLATLTALPGWLAAQQAQTSQPDSERHEQPTGESPAPSHEGSRTLPESGEPAMNPAGRGMQADDTLLSALTPQNLKRMDVVGISGEKIGKVEDVVRSRDDGFIYAVISSGGILGIGAQEIPVPLKALRVHGDKLQIKTSKDSLQGWPEYEEDQYVELGPMNRPISEFSAFEVTPPKELEKESAPGMDQ